MRQTPDDGRETYSFKIADQKIENLLKRLSDKNLCPCCTARALIGHAAFLAEQTLGSAKAAEMFEDLISSILENNIPAPDPLPSTQAH